MDGSIIIGVELDDSGFTQALSRLRESASQAIEQLLQGFRSGSFAQAGAMAAGELLSGVMTEDFGGTGLSSGAALLSAFAGAGHYDTGLTAGSELASGFQAGGSVLPGIAGNLASGIKAAFLGQSWYSVGYHISAGVASGVSGGSGLISQAAVSAARAALAAAKKALGVASPSKVFRDQVGRMIPAGIAQGITQDSPRVTGAIRQQSWELVAAARDTVLPAASASSGGIANQAAALRLQLEAPLVVDGRELARATADYVGRQLQWEVM